MQFDFPFQPRIKPSLSNGSLRQSFNWYGTPGQDPNYWNCGGHLNLIMFKPSQWNSQKGGLRHYAMVGPEGQKHYCKAYYQDIEFHKMFSYKDAFCDEDGRDLPDMPSMKWNNTFSAQNAGSTIVNVVLSFEKEEDIENIIKMGMKEGFTMALDNLDELLIKLIEQR